jgi:hypothetical protein
LETISGDKIVQMLKGQKCSSDKSGLGFDKFVASSSHVASNSKIVFIKPEIFETHTACLEKKENVIVHEHVKAEFEIPVKKQSKSKFIPTCFHCGIIGHTRPYCHQNHSQKPWTKMHDPKKGKIGKKSSMPKYVPWKKIL